MEAYKVSVIVPVYNGETYLEECMESILSQSYQNIEVIFVDDGSTDRTKQICSERGYAVLHLPINMGIGGAVQTGYRYARDNGYDIAVQIDGDGQHDVGFSRI